MEIEEDEHLFVLINQLDFCLIVFWFLENIEKSFQKKTNNQPGKFAGEEI